MTTALATTVGSTMATAVASAAASKTPAKTSTKFWTNEYWAHKTSATGEVKLYMFRKRASAPKAGEAPLPVLMLVHGSSMSSRSSFDLATPGKGEYSVMNVFAQWGYDVWTMDHENYGHSTQTSGNSDIASGVEDLKAGIELIAKETGAQKVHMMGESSGAIRAGAYAMARPDRVDRLVLGAFTYKGDNSPTLAERAKGLDYYRTHNRRLRDRAMIFSIATRDKQIGRAHV
jgi:pimeloyl-ACP methyl ester carboxylesterase